MSTLAWLRRQGELKPMVDVSVVSVEEVPSWLVGLLKSKHELHEDSILHVSSESDDAGESGDGEVVEGGESDDSDESSDVEVVEVDVSCPSFAGASTLPR